MNPQTTFSDLRLSTRAGLLLRTLILLGYPLIALLGTFLGFGAATTTLSIPYRVVVLMIALYITASNMNRPLGGHLNGWLITFFAIYTARLCYDWLFPDIIGAGYSLLYFFVLVLIPTCGCMLAGTDTVSDELFGKLLLCFGLVFCLGSLTAQFVGLSYNPWEKYGVENNRLTFEALNPISIGIAASVTLITAFYLLIETRPTFYWRIVSWAAVGLGGTVLLVANSRGPIISLAAAIAAFFMLRMRRLAYVLPVALLGSLIVSSNNDLFTNIIERFVDVDPFAVNLSNQERLDSQALAIQSLINHPILGEHYIDQSLGPGAYPHNIVIETGMALGLVGLSLLGLMLVRVWLNITHYYNRSHPLLMMLLLQQLVTMQFSGAIYGADSLFMLLGLALTARPGVRSDP
jgi:O-Antigen ligase